ncbi:MAG: hypothetical protein OEU90_06175 [Gammaproteobacteria bacterium]|jgi:malate synthase|nr:hypothetical protein [Gammaproteobacteria bacterium]MDH3805045.1 hypothetical protein [Gammaproteobacteria bacterium]
MHALNLERMSGIAHYATSLLDDVIPLRDVSHADVVRYSVEIPMRYAECFGILACGRKISLVDNRHFIGWSCHSAKRSLLFRNREVQVEIQVDPDDPNSCNEPGYVRDIIVKPKRDKIINADALRKFIGIDGSLLVLPA